MERVFRSHFKTTYWRKRLIGKSISMKLNVYSSLLNDLVYSEEIVTGGERQKPIALHIIVVPVASYHSGLCMNSLAHLRSEIVQYYFSKPSPTNLRENGWIVGNSCKC